MRELGRFIKRELERRNLLQLDLAEKVGVTESTISRAVTGKRIPSAELCVLIAKALDLPPELLLRRAKILPENEDYRRFTSEFDYKFSKLVKRDQNLIIRMMDYLLNEVEEDNQVEGKQGKQGYQQKRLDISS